MTISWWRWHFQMHFLEWKYINFEILLKFVPKGPVNNVPALVQIMAWHWPGKKPLSEPMMLRSLIHICIPRPQWVRQEGWWKFHLLTIQCFSLYLWIMKTKLSILVNNENHTKVSLSLDQILYIMMFIHLIPIHGYTNSSSMCHVCFTIDRMHANPACRPSINSAECVCHGIAVQMVARIFKCHQLHRKTQSILVLNLLFGLQRNMQGL